MADALPYPLPTFHFSVDLGGTIINCSEISGLDQELDVIEYRNGNSGTPYSKIKMAGLRKGSDITIKKGLFKDDTQYNTWFNSVKMNVPERKAVTVMLLDETNTAVFTWKIVNAWPKKISAPTLSADKSEVAIETIVLVHEGCTMDGTVPA